MCLCKNCLTSAKIFDVREISYDERNYDCYRFRGEEWFALFKKFSIPQQQEDPGMMQPIYFTDCLAKQFYIELYKRSDFFQTMEPQQRVDYQREVNREQMQHVANIWEQVITQYFDQQLPYFEIKPKKNLAGKKIIWQYWGQDIDETLPDMVKLCFASVERFKDECEVIRLTDKTIADYIDLPEFIWQKRQNPAFGYAFFSDILRLALLSAYGGVWADATILLTAPLNPALFEQDFFVFQRNAHAENQSFWQHYNSDYFGWSPTHAVNMLNSFIAADKKSELLHHCLQLMLNFWHSQTQIPHYFFFQIMFDVLTKKFKPYQGVLVDDTLPHVLQAVANEPFDAQTFLAILQSTNVHKMTYFNQVPKGSYYEHLLCEFGLILS